MPHRHHIEYTYELWHLDDLNILFMNKVYLFQYMGKTIFVYVNLQANAKITRKYDLMQMWELQEFFK